MIAKLLLVAVACIAMVMALSGRSTQQVQAWKKIGLVFITIAMIVAVISPEILTYVANLIDVGRGTDLVVYVFASLFIFYVINQYLKSQDQEEKLMQLSRQIALNDARSRYIFRTIATKKSASNTGKK